MRLLFVLVVFCTVNSHSQVIFQCELGDSLEIVPEDVIVNTNGEYAIVGRDINSGAGGYDIYFLLLNSVGDTIMTKVYGGASGDKGQSIVETSNAGYAITGNTSSSGMGNNDLFLLLLDSVGNINWAKTYGGGQADNGNAIIVTSDGSYLIAGTTQSFGGGFTNAYAVKTDVNGDTLWTKVWGGWSYDWLLDVIETSDGNYLFTGFAESFGAGSQNVYVIKSGPQGDTLWTKTYGKHRGYANAVIETSDGNYVLTGFAMPDFLEDDDLFAMKINPNNGDTLWTIVIDGGGYDYGYDVIEADNGSLLVTGYGLDTTSGQSKNYIIKISSQGEFIWAKRYGSTGYETSYAMARVDQDAYISVGRISLPSRTLVVKSDNYGNNGCEVEPFNPTIATTEFEYGSGGDINYGAFVLDFNPSIGNTTTQDSILCVSVGNKEHPENINTLNIHPNPTTGIFTVQGTVATIQVYDLFGRLVHSTNKRKVDISDKPKGVYIVKAGEAVRKVVLH